MAVAHNSVDSNDNDLYKNALVVIPVHTTVLEWSCPDAGHSSPFRGSTGSSWTVGHPR